MADICRTHENVRPYTNGEVARASVPETLQNKDTNQRLAGTLNGKPRRQMYLKAK